MRSRLTGLLFVFAIFLSCSDQIVSECDDDDNDNTVIMESVTFSQIQNDIFTPSCALSGCHAGNFPAAGLDLSPGSWERLVSVTSQQKSDLLLVKPADSENSYLVHKLSGTNTSVMPPRNMLDQALIDSVRTWIDNGALNN